MTIITESELREYWKNGRGQLPAFPPGTRFTDSAREFLRQHEMDAQSQVIESNHVRLEWDKPNPMTQLDAGRFASKTDPRLILRGRVDSLHAFVMLAAAKARSFQMMNLASHLDTLAAYCREIMSAEYNMRQVAPLILLGKREEELHEISHWPDRHLGIQHIIPGPQDHEMIHWLNVLRTQARDVEVVALEAFGADPASIKAELEIIFHMR